MFRDRARNDDEVGQLFEVEDEEGRQQVQQVTAGGHNKEHGQGLGEIHRTYGEMAERHPPQTEEDLRDRDPGCWEASSSSSTMATRPSGHTEHADDESAAMWSEPVTGQDLSSGLDDNHITLLLHALRLVAISLYHAEVRSSRY